MSKKYRDTFFFFWHYPDLAAAYRVKIIWFFEYKKQIFAKIATFKTYAFKKSFPGSFFATDVAIFKLLEHSPTHMFKDEEV